MTGTPYIRAMQADREALFSEAYLKRLTRELVRYALLNEGYPVEVVSYAMDGPTGDPNLPG